MNKNLRLIGLLLALLLSFGASAQDTVEYTERVPTENYSPQTLQARAADWVNHQFPFGPKSNYKSDPASGRVAVQGTIKLKPVDAKGKDMERIAHFDFTFTATEDGYTYAVNNFQVEADPTQAGQLTPLEVYVTQLSTEKNVEKTHNDRRVRAQANSLASDIAMSFRSFMNQIPTTQDGSVGLPANGEGN